MDKWDRIYEMFRAETEGRAIGMDAGEISILQAVRVRQREQREQLDADLKKMYALAKYLHAHGRPITNKKALRLLKRHGYDVSEFED